MTRDEVIDLLSAIAVGDRRTVGKTDVEFWLAIIGELPKDLAMHAVVDHFHDRPGVWLEPGHVVAGVRRIRRELAERESDEQRAYRQDAQAIKAADEMRVFAASAIIGRIKDRARNPRLEAAEALLQTCRGETECSAAIREYNAARREAAGKRPRQVSA